MAQIPQPMQASVIRRRCCQRWGGHLVCAAEKIPVGSPVCLADWGNPASAGPQVGKDGGQLPWNVFIRFFCSSMSKTGEPVVCHKDDIDVSRGDAAGLA